MSDASKDGTNEIVAEFAKTTSIPVKLIANSQRAGKAAAVNRCIRELHDVDIVVLLSGDVLPKGDCVSLLVREFADPSVGVAAARTVPVGVEGNPAFEITRLMWSLHHVIAIRYPKSTEITAFRNLVESIDPTTFVDEAALELTLERKGFVTRYLPEAEVLSPTPLCLGDYIKQRAVVTLGYLRMYRKEGRRMETQSLVERIRAIVVVWQTQGIHLPVLLLAMAMEIIVRAWAWIQFLAGNRNHGIWGRSESTKRRLVYILDD